MPLQFSGITVSCSTRRPAPASGITLAEYGVLFGLVTLAGMAALQLFGGSTAGLLNQGGQALANNSSFSYLTHVAPRPASVPPAGSSPAPSSSSPSSGPMMGSGYYSVVLNAQGQPSLKLVNGAQGVATNVSSIDGSTMNTLGSLMLATKLDQLAAAQSHPALKSYLTDLATKAFYLGSAEADLDDIETADVSGNALDADNLNDIKQLKPQLLSLLKNPPPQLNQALALAVMPLGADVYNIANNYANTAQSGNRLKTVQNWGNGTAGSALISAATAASDQSQGLKGSMMSYYTATQIRQVGAQILADNHMNNVPVETTLTDGTLIDAKAGNPAPAAMATQP